MIEIVFEGKYDPVRSGSCKLAYVYFTDRGIYQNYRGELCLVRRDQLKNPDSKFAMNSVFLVQVVSVPVVNSALRYNVYPIDDDNGSFEIWISHSGQMMIRGPESQKRVMIAAGASLKS